MREPSALYNFVSRLHRLHRMQQEFEVDGGQACFDVLGAVGRRLRE